MSFPLKGNENVKSAVVSAINARRLPHAIMIEGEDGLGKHTLANFLASAAVCEAGGLPCGSCHGCHLAKIGSHPDISFVSPEDGKKNISVAQIRTLRNEAFVKAHSASHRVFIIEQANRMNDQAQNALLKILEEPPHGVIFILITPSRTMMLETIISRCAVFSLSAPKREDSILVLKEKSNAQDEEIVKALEAVSNNIGRALKILNKSADDKASATALEFLQAWFSGSEYDMLTLLRPLEKNRVLAEEFCKALQLEIARKLREISRNSIRAKALDTFFDDTKYYLELLKTNINLSLLFCAAVSRAKTLII